MKHKEREKRKQNVVKIWEKHYPDITVAEIEKMTGLSYRTIYRYLQEEGCPLPPKQKKKIDMRKVKNAHQLYATHGNKKKVAHLMDMSYSQVRRYLNIKPE